MITFDLCLDVGCQKTTTYNFVRHSAVVSEYNYKLKGDSNSPLEMKTSPDYSGSMFSSKDMNL